MFLGRLAAIAALAAGGYWLKKKMAPSARQLKGELSFAQDSIEVDIPISTAYNQWTQFETFPRFMKDVEEYCLSEGWIKVPAGKTLDRKGRPLLITLKGKVEAFYR